MKCIPINIKENRNKVFRKKTQITNVNDIVISVVLEGLPNISTKFTINGYFSKYSSCVIILIRGITKLTPSISKNMPIIKRFNNIIA